jgi:Pyridine nucleotide-disulphide oxidoreductase
MKIVNIFWSGTLSGGVSELRNNHFTTYTTANGLASNTVCSIAEGAEGKMANDIHQLPGRHTLQNVSAGSHLERALTPLWNQQRDFVGPRNDQQFRRFARLADSRRVAGKAVYRKVSTTVHMGRKSKVIIVGGGFGGIRAAQALKSAPVEVTLIDRRNYHLFQPLLYQVATGSLSPGEIAAPLRSVLSRQKNIRVLLAKGCCKTPHSWFCYWSAGNFAAEAWSDPLHTLPAYGSFECTHIVHSERPGVGPERFAWLDDGAPPGTCEEHWGHLRVDRRGCG